jgi:DNA-directed RNA polymerase subunit beta'
MDITAGLPRVEELFEARMPKGKAEISHIDGLVEIFEDEGLRKVTVTSREAFTVPIKLSKRHERLVADGDQVEVDQLVARLEKKKGGEVEEVRSPDAGIVSFTEDGINISGDDVVEREYAIPHNAKLMVENGQEVRAGDQLTDGPINPQEYLETRGRESVQRYLVKEVQRVYRSQGVTINDKHIEIIVRQMLRKVRVDQPGDAEKLPFELIDRFEFEDLNDHVLAEGGEPATAETVLLGVTKASLNTNSFLAAAAFQETTRVLTEAAINGAKDDLIGLKENVIIGKLIPAGTGAPANIAARREAERRAAAEALAGGELPEGFGEEYNVFLSEAAEVASPPDGEGENPFLPDADEAASAASAEEDLGENPFLENPSADGAGVPTAEESAEPEGDPKEA